MKKLLLCVLVALLSVTEPAQACIDFAQFKIEDIRYADAIVVGRISNYRIVKDESAIKNRAQMLEYPDLPPQVREGLERQTGSITDYAAFDIEVREVILGSVPKRINVTWDNSTFKEPETHPPGPYLIALRNPRSKIPPLRGASATILPNQQPQLMTVLQAPCAGNFILDNSPENVSDIRTILKGGEVADRNFKAQLEEEWRRIDLEMQASRARDAARKVMLGFAMIGSAGLLLATWIFKRRKRRV